MTYTQSKIKVILEVFFVFLVTFLIIWAMQIPLLGEWKSRVLQRPFLEYAVMIAMPSVFLLVTRRNFAAYGISFKNLKYHLDVVLTCFLPVAVSCVPFAFLNWTRWDGALLLAVIELAVLFAIAWMLRNKPTASNLGTISAFSFLLLGISPSLGPMIGKASSAFIFYFAFLGPGEEILFRGYIQSRLNETFGRPYRFFGVNWGWGVVITSLIFGFMHVLNHFNPFLGNFELMWWWGLWTFFSGLVYGFIREKTGSVVAPAILHGLPQAIAYAFLEL
ncbi:MAG: CPBP family intramembrane metalloprotease [Thermoplasmatales archaeon]|nr:CPBP family intramembrane metalloprotease [Thermoplasmatales archaeon]